MLNELYEQLKEMQQLEVLRLAFYRYLEGEAHKENLRKLADSCGQLEHYQLENVHETYRLAKRDESDESDESDETDESVERFIKKRNVRGFTIMNRPSNHLVLNLPYDILTDFVPADVELLDCQVTDTHGLEWVQRTIDGLSKSKTNSLLDTIQIGIHPKQFNSLRFFSNFFSNAADPWCQTEIHKLSLIQNKFSIEIVRPNGLGAVDANKIKIPIDARVILEDASYIEQGIWAKKGYSLLIEIGGNFPLFNNREECPTTRYKDDNNEIAPEYGPLYRLQQSPVIFLPSCAHSQKYMAGLVDALSRYKVLKFQMTDLIMMSILVDNEQKLNAIDWDYLWQLPNWRYLHLHTVEGGSKITWTDERFELADLIKCRELHKNYTKIIGSTEVCFEKVSLA